jgi:hypothetical protein
MRFSLRLKLRTADVWTATDFETINRESFLTLWQEHVDRCSLFADIGRPWTWEDLETKIHSDPEYYFEEF